MAISPFKTIKPYTKKEITYKENSGIIKYWRVVNTKNIGETLKIATNSEPREVFLNGVLIYPSKQNNSKVGKIK
jgi:hypothetical protein